MSAVDIPVMNHVLELSLSMVVAILLALSTLIFRTRVSPVRAYFVDTDRNRRLYQATHALHRPYAQIWFVHCAFSGIAYSCAVLLSNAADHR